MSWTYAPRTDGRVEFQCDHGTGHTPCWSPVSCIAAGCDGCCRRDDFPGRQPRVGDLAICGDGKLGLITHAGQQQVESTGGSIGQAWIGISMAGDGQGWASRNPVIVGNLYDIIKERKVEGWPCLGTQ